MTAGSSPGDSARAGGEPSGAAAGGERLARRYRRALLAYPRSYRHARGAEMLSMLLDGAPPGRARPTLREALDLLRGGLRARLGRPASRSVVGWALVVATIGGLFGAAFATRVGWEAAAPFPGRDEALAMTAEILPGQGFTGFEEPAATFTMYGQPLSRDMLDDLLSLDGGEYALAGVGGGIAGAPVVPLPELAGLARRNLAAHGWTVHPTKTLTLDVCDGPQCPPPPTVTIVAARRGDTTFRLAIDSDPNVQPPVSVTFQPVTPVAVYPLGVAGGLAGALAAFLVFGWASRRTQGGRPDGLEKVMLGFTLFFWWGPTVLGVTSMARHHVGEAHPSWHPMWEWLAQPAASGIFLLGCGSALVGLVACAVNGGDRAGIDIAAAR